MSLALKEAAGHLPMSTTFWSPLLPAVMVLLLTGCGKREREKESPENDEAGYFEVEPVAAPGTDKNQLAQEPTDFLRSRAGDAIHWQAWSPALLESARLEQRPIFAIVGTARYSTCSEFLNVFTDPANKFAKQFNDDYLCTLIDAEAAPELGLLSHTLSNEIRRTFSFPSMIWFSHEGNPVGWFPIKGNDLDNVMELIDRSNEMVSEIWLESPEYFIRNSQTDNKSRGLRSKPTPIAALPDRAQTSEFLFSSARSLTALYDPATRAIDQAGGLVPAELLGFVAVSLELPNQPGYVRERGEKMLVESCEDLRSFAITDPLDGGIFASRRSQDWTLPIFIKAAATQSKMALAYSYAYRLTGREEFATQAERAFSFTRGTLGAGGDGIGAFQSVRNSASEDDLYFWSLSDLQELLTPAQMEAIEVAFGVSRRGNIPTELDPERRFFRRNILSQAKSSSEVAAALSIDPAAAKELIKLATETLRAYRAVEAEETEALFIESTRITEVNALHAFSLLRCGQLLDRSDLITEGRTLLTFLRKEHYDERKGLWRIPPRDGRRGSRARGRDYASLLQAVMELYRLDLQAADLAWAEALAREALRILIDEEGLMLEAPPEERVGPLPIHYRSMVLGDSTWGSILDPLERLSRLSSKHQFEDAATNIRLHLHALSERAPIVHSDFLQSLIVPAADCVAILHGDPNDASFAPLHAVLLKTRYLGVVVVRPDALQSADHKEFAFPSASPGVTLVTSGKALGTATDPAALTALLEAAFSPK